MLIANNISVRFGGRTLFKDVNLKFEGNNCYGLIGANGAGKSTFLKILAGDRDSTTGEIIKGPSDRISVLVQDHNAYDEYSVIETVIMGDKELYDIKQEKDAIYLKEDFTDEDGIRAGILEDLFLKKNGWQAESDASILAEYEQIMSDSSRKNRAIKAAKDEAKRLSKRVSALQKAGKRRK